VRSVFQGVLVVARVSRATTGAASDEHCLSIDQFANQYDNIFMSAAALDNLANDPTALADDEAVMASFVSGKPLDPDVAKRVRDRGRQIREEVFRRHGLLDIGVPAIRELRGELPDA
jgi:hypothetical protein